MRAMKTNRSTCGVRQREEHALERACLSTHIPFPANAIDTHGRSRNGHPTVSRIVRLQFGGSSPSFHGCFRGVAVFGALASKARVVRFRPSRPIQIPSNSEEFPPENAQKGPYCQQNCQQNGFTVSNRLELLPNIRRTC
jgi:hypothetical protein